MIKYIPYSKISKIVQLVLFYIAYSQNGINVHELALNKQPTLSFHNSFNALQEYRLFCCRIRLERNLAYQQRDLNNKFSSAVHFYSLDNIIPVNERFGDYRFKLQIESLLLNQQNNALLHTAFRHVNLHSYSLQPGKGIYRDNLEVSITNSLTYEKVEYFTEEMEYANIPNIEIKYHHLHTLLLRVCSKNTSKNIQKNPNITQSLQQISIKNPIYLQLSGQDYTRLQQSDMKTRQGNYFNYLEIIKEELLKLLPNEQFILQEKFMEKKIQYLKKEDRATIIIINISTTFTPEEILRALMGKLYIIIFETSELHEHEHGQPLSQIINSLYDQNNRRNELIRRYSSFRSNQFQVLTNIFWEVYQQNTIEFIFTELLEIIETAQKINCIENSLGDIVKDLVNKKQTHNNAQKQSIQDTICSLIKQWRITLKQSTMNGHKYFFDNVQEFKTADMLEDQDPNLLVYEIHSNNKILESITFYQPKGEIVATFSFKAGYVGFAGLIGQILYDMPRKQYFRFKFAELIQIEAEMQQFYLDFALILVSQKIKNRVEKDLEEEI